MIELVAQDWYDAWDSVNRLYGTEPDRIVDDRFATRAFSYDNVITIRENHLGGLGAPLVGYQQYKLNLFDRRYIKPGEKERVAEKLLGRINKGAKFTNLNYSFNGDVSVHDQGGCLVNVLVTAMQRGSKYEVTYDFYIRTAEVTKRLLVDFIKFQELVAFWNGVLGDKLLKYEIRVNARALYGQALFLVIYDSLKRYDELFKTEHWLHRTVQKQYDKMFSPNYRLKMGKRVREHVRKIREE